MTLQMLAGCCFVLGALQAAPPRSQAPQSAPPPAQRQPAAKPPQGKAGAPQGLTREAEAYYQFLLGRHLESEGDAAGAIAAYSEAARLDPKSAEIRAEISSLYARENRLAEATAMAEAALKLDPRNVSATRLLGFIYADMAQVDEGMAAFEAGEAASAARAAGYLETARRSLEVPDPAVDMVLGRIYVRSGASDKAISVLSQLVVDQPGQPEPVNLLLQAYLQAGRTAEATSALEAAVGLQPQFSRCSVNSTSGSAGGPMPRGPTSARSSGCRRTSSCGRASRRCCCRRVAMRRSAGRSTCCSSSGARAPRTCACSICWRRRSARRGRLDDAEATARQLMAVAPGSPTGAYVLGLVLGQKQQYRGVVETLEPVVGAPASTSASGGGSRPAPGAAAARLRVPGAR